MIPFAKALIFCFLGLLSLSNFGYSSESFNPLDDFKDNCKRVKLSDSSFHNEILTNSIDEEQNIILPPRKSAFVPFVPCIEKGILHILEIATSATDYYKLIAVFQLTNSFIDESYKSLANVVIQYRKACEKYKENEENDFSKVLKLYFQVRIVNREFYKACSASFLSDHSYSNQGLGINKRKLNCIQEENPGL